jgi:hypothetical protein
MTSRRLRIAPLLVAAALSGSLDAAPARAAADDAERAAAAQMLFDEGKRLVKEGQYAAACPKFAESQRLDPASGALFQLADCHEKLGRTASAWAEFLEVASLARREGQLDWEGRERIAKARASKLEPSLVRLVVVGPAQRLNGLVLRRDGVEMAEGQWDTPIPVDPGEHTVTASIRGREVWSTKVLVSRGTERVAVPVLKSPPEELASTPAPPPAPPKKLGPWRTAGLAIGGVGLAGIGVGTALGLVAKSTLDASNKQCDGNACTAKGDELRHAAIAAGNGSTGAFIAGGALLAGGVLLFALGPSPSSMGAAVGVGPAVVGRGAMVSIGGGF